MAEFDLLVIGGGSGGVACARRAASYGARAGVIENDRLGGTCVHRGCIPKKLLVYASHFSHDFEDAAGYGWTVGERAFDWRAMVRAKSDELDRLEGIYQRLLRDSGATYIRGTGRLLDAHTVAVGDETHHAETIVIATGGRPTMPEHPRNRACHRLRRDVRPARVSRTHGDRGGRLHRLRIRLHHAGPRQRSVITALPRASCRCAASTGTCATCSARRCARAESI